MSDSEAPAPRPPSYSCVETTQIVLPGDTNALGTAFGGKVVQWIDIAAAVAARRHSDGISVTASIDSLQFTHPIQLGDIVVLRACVNRAWRSSMEVGVRVECEQGGDRSRAVRAVQAYLTFVAVDGDGAPRAVAPIAPENDDERRRFAAAERRRQRRLDQRTTG